MNGSADPLVSNLASERLKYSTGELLGADDFRDEQTYHRRQLARALLHLHGSGTIGGLRVVHRFRAAQDDVDDEVELEVRPGMALDHAGRLIEVPREACLRLRRWYAFVGARPPASAGLNVDSLRRAWRADASVTAGGVVVADVLLTFHPCPRGYTPAFASGPFDALDASQPSRVRDAYELTLVPRFEADGDLPDASDPWAEVTGATLEDRRDAAIEASLDLWQRPARLRVTPGAAPGDAAAATLGPGSRVSMRNLVTTGRADSRAAITTAIARGMVLEVRGSIPLGGAAIERDLLVPNPVLHQPPEIPLGFDATAVLLARLRLPASENSNAGQPPIPDWSQPTWAAVDGHVDNRVRRVLLPPAVVQRLIG
jgi:hypothetical protein